MKVCLLAVLEQTVDCLCWADMTVRVMGVAKQNAPNFAGRFVCSISIGLDNVSRRARLVGRDIDRYELNGIPQHCRYLEAS
jgi:hypothetical protein